LLVVSVRIIARLRTQLIDYRLHRPVRFAKSSLRKSSDNTTHIVLTAAEIPAESPSGSVFRPRARLALIRAITLILAILIWRRGSSMPMNSRRPLRHQHAVERGSRGPNVLPFLSTPALFDVHKNPRHIQLANAFCRYPEIRHTTVRRNLTDLRSRSSKRGSVGKASSLGYAPCANRIAHGWR
jgi:hypothetical protein